MTGAERIATAFAAARAEGRAALMPYMMGGFPDQDTAAAVAGAYVDAGADLIELGVPFSDPLADGPVIHSAGVEALRNGATTDRVLDLGAEVAAEVPVVVMTYANLVLARGPEAFAAALAQRGISGLIVPDVPLEEGEDLLAACDAAGIALVPLIAPTTPDDRLAVIGARARGFLYTVSTLGTTGERSDGEYAGLVRRAKEHTSVPVAVGFGIGSPDRALAAAEQGADGVIVGSRLVRAVAEGEDVQALVRSFTDALG